MSNFETTPYQFINQRKLQGRSLSNWSHIDLWILGISILLVIGAYVYGDRLANSGTGVILMLVMACITFPLLIRRPNSYGRAYYEFVLFGRSLVRRYVLDGVWWKADDTDSSLKQHLRYKGLSGYSRPVIPLSTEIIEATDEDGTPHRIALTHNLDRPYDHLHVYARGGRFADQDVASQNASVYELADIVNRTLAMTELKAGVSYLRSIGPANQAGSLMYMTKNASPIVVHPEQFALDEAHMAHVEWLRSYAQELWPSAQAHGAADDWTLIIITIKRKSEWRGAYKNKIASEELYNLPVVRLGRNLVQDLKKSTRLGFGDVHILKPHELFLLNRTSWDVFGVGEFLDSYASIVTRFAHDEHEMYRQLEEHLSCWPEQAIVSETDDTIRMDSNWISAIRITKLPERVRCDQYLALNSIGRTDQWFRHFCGGESISGSRETMQLIVSQSALINFQQAFFGKAVVQHPGFRRKQRQLDDQTEMISAHSIAQLYNELFVVVSPSMTKLKSDREGLIADLLARGFDAEVISVLDLQLDAVLTGAVGAYRL